MMNHCGEPMSPMTAAEIAIQNRKFAKTCVEKKRRDRINKCLDELKEIMSQTDDKARYQKMEKAEILEMAVNYMRMSMSSGKFSQAPTSDIYSVAYNQLLADFGHSLAIMPGLGDDFKAQLLNNLGAQILRGKSAGPAQPAPPPPQAKKRRSNETSFSSTGKKYCTDSNSHQYYMYSKYAGSCSSLDTNVNLPVSPCGSSSSSCADGQVLNLSSSSSASSSACSSPNSSSSIKSTDSNNKIFRPYL